MKILLTGAAGLIGGEVWRQGRSDHQFVAVDIADSIESLGGVRASVEDAQAMRRAATGCDVIVHTAALHGHFLSVQSHARFIQANVLGSENIFQAALSAGVRRVVVASTMEVVFGRYWATPGSVVFDESSPPAPDSIYSVTKLQVEVLGQLYAQRHGLEVVQLRYMGVSSHRLDQFSYGLLARGVDVSDAASATLRACTVAGLRNETLHVGPDTPINAEDILESRRDPWMVLERCWPGCRALLSQRHPQPQSRDFWPVTRIDRARRVLGWQPRITFTKMLQAQGWNAKPGAACSAT